MKLLTLLGAAAIATSAFASEPLTTISLSADESYPAVAQSDSVVVYNGKSIFIPKDLQKMDLNDPVSKWSYSRMVETENIVLFWAPGFGNDITKAPDLDGHNMKVDLANLLARLESFYSYFYKDLGWAKPGSNADRYKMMVMLDYSLEGTAYGGDYDGVIGALWIAPNRVQDECLNTIAHELGHCFQLQIPCDGQGQAWGGHQIYEMASQWMLWQVNPDWQADEYFHLQAFRELTHKTFLDVENIYHSPYVLELWGEKHGPKFIAELFRQGKVGEDPVQTYKRITGIDQQAFNDEMIEGQRRFVNWDIPRVWNNTRAYANQWHTPIVNKGKWCMPDSAHTPGAYGFNVIELTPRAGKVTVDFRGNSSAREAGWRYTLVAVDKEGQAHYSAVGKRSNGSISETYAEAPKHLWLVVMAAPTVHTPFVHEGTNPVYPYRYKVK